MDIRNNVKLTKKDMVIILLMAIAVWLLASSSLGFLSVGYDNMYYYVGQDDFSIASQTKELLQERWCWNTDRLGTPYGHNSLEYPSVCLQIPEFLMLKFWGLFTKDVPTVINLQLVFTFVLCAVLAYLVLRKMTVGYAVATVGSVLYAFNPYIYARNIGHYCLSACYFIPLVFYLCYCCYFDSSFLKIDKTIICKRSLLILLMCFCISTNGIGYYPFFACFYLAVTALCKFLRTKKIKDILPSLKVMLLICSLVIIALLPVFVHRKMSNIPSITVRSQAEMETLALKITQLFVPLYSHGIGFVQNFIDRYNTNMPLVNENKMSYLGLVGDIGFLVGLLYAFGIKENSENEDVVFFSKLNLAAVLCMSVGGFISLITVATNVYALRGFNRISIFISFCSITIFCLVVQHNLLDAKKITKGKQVIVYCILVLVVAVGLWNQTPTLVNDGSSLLVNKKQWDNDAEFVKEIENSLQPGDMVYQLPYHRYPEGGSVNKMNDYQLLVGYIHSDNLKWSYGGFAGGKGDKWSKYVSELDTSSMLETIIAAGFKGLYIESRAYTENELDSLLKNFESQLGYDPKISSDGKLYFYNLYPYISKHEELLTGEMIDVDYPPYETGNKIMFTKEGYNAGQYVTTGIMGPEIDYSWTSGDSLNMSFTFADAASKNIVGKIECINVFNGNQRIEIEMSGSNVYSESINAAKTITFNGKVPRDGKVTIKMSFPDSISPAALGISEDGRNIAIAIKSMEFDINEGEN